MDVWTLIDVIIAVAFVDYAHEFKHCREGIVEHIYTTMSASPPCQNCLANNNAEIEKHVEEELNPHRGLFNDENKKNKNIIEIKQQLEYANQEKINVNQPRPSYEPKTKDMHDDPMTRAKAKSRPLKIGKALIDPGEGIN